MASLSLLDTATAVEKLRDGHVIAYPTEAVFGLGCDPFNESAVRKLLTLKGRHESAGLVLIASDFSQLQPWISPVDAQLIDKARRTWPGPVTWLFPRARDVPDYVAGHHETIAVRITSHKISRELCQAFGSALISTSANHTATMPARSVDEVEQYFGQQLGGVLAGALGGAKNPSEIRDLITGDIIRQS
jgi:L-threonylcarbamoyladenylate synthase